MLPLAQHLLPFDFGFRISRSCSTSASISLKLAFVAMLLQGKMQNKASTAFFEAGSAFFYRAG